MRSRNLTTDNPTGLRKDRAFLLRGGGWDRPDWVGFQANAGFLITKHSGTRPRGIPSTTPRHQD